MPIYLMFIGVLLSVEFCVTLKPYLKGAPFYNASASRRSPSASRRSPSASRRSPSASRRSPSASRRSPSASRRSPLISSKPVSGPRNEALNDARMPRRQYARDALGANRPSYNNSLSHGNLATMAADYSARRAQSIELLKSIDIEIMSGCNLALIELPNLFQHLLFATRFTALLCARLVATWVLAVV